MYDFRCSSHTAVGSRHHLDQQKSGGAESVSSFLLAVNLVTHFSSNRQTGKWIGFIGLYIIRIIASLNDRCLQGCVSTFNGFVLY